MGMNGPVRMSYEKIYPITAMAAFTTGTVVDVEAFCIANNTTMTGILITTANQVQVADVEVIPAGQDLSNYYVLQLIVGMPHEIAVRRVRTTNTTATQVFILGINP